MGTGGFTELSNEINFSKFIKAFAQIFIFKIFNYKKSKDIYYN